jgi:hypothetical protein
MGYEQLSDGDVEQIRDLRSRGHPLKAVADQFNVSTRQVTRITSGKAWRSGFTPVRGTMSAVARFQQDRGWSNCPFGPGEKPCGCWEKDKPEDHCTNDAWKVKVLAAIATAEPGEPPVVTRQRCHTM